MALTKVDSQLVNGAITTDSSGNVGIGTASPSAKLEVAGSVRSLRSGSTAAVLQVINDNNSWNITSGTATAQFRIDNNLLGTALTIDSNNNLSMAGNNGFAGQFGTSATYGYIANSNSSSFMQFQGASNATPYIIYVRAGSNGVQLNNGATSWSATSDARLKNVTGTYANALADIAQIEPVKFTWKDDVDSKPQVGVLAQSVLPVVPEAVDAQTLVRSEDETEYLTVRYTELIPLMIASIQELKAELDATKAEVATLKGNVA